MPELPEVETVRKSLEKHLIGRKILKIRILYPKIFEENDPKEVEKNIQNQTIHKIHRRGKWLIFELDDFFLMSHLRMEGKYFYRTKEDPIGKHEHVIFTFQEEELRYQDTRKFGRMVLLKKEDYSSWMKKKGLGIEPWDANFKKEVVAPMFQKHHIPIKTLLLDQHILLGIGNIYANEILFLAKISPFRFGDELSSSEVETILQCCKKILEQAIKDGGTTIHSYTSEEGVTGRFQQHLNVHQRENEPCICCKTLIKKEFLHTRATYYCPHCQQ